VKVQLAVAGQYK